MLELTVQDGTTEVVLQFEHSLLSLSKWESKHKKAFMSTPVKDAGEMIEYFEAMLVGSYSPGVVYRLDPEQLDEITNYINEPQTATHVPEEEPSKKFAAETVTSELIYYWMTALKINWAAETWHLSRLMTLIQITNFKSQPEKKQSKGEALSKWREANAAIKKKYGTNG